MKIKQPLRVAIVGCGEIGQHQHIPSWLKCRGADLISLCDTNEDLVKSLAGKFSIDSYYTDYTKMLDNEELDIVDICTPPQVHHVMCIQAMEKGCHVLLEKPAALNLKEFDEMASVAERSGLKLCVVHNKLFEPVMLKACAMVNRGDIGELAGIDIQILHSWKRAEHMLKDQEHWGHGLPAGLLSEMIPHPMYLLLAFFDKPEPVAAISGKASRYDWVIADEFRAIFRGTRGMGTVIFHSNSAQGKVIIDIHGNKKHLRVDILNSMLTKYGSGTGTRISRGLENLDQGFTILADTIINTLRVISGRFHTGHHTLMQRFIESIQNNNEPPVTMQQARDVVEMTQKVIALMK